MRLVCVEEKGLEVFRASVAQMDLGGFTSIFYPTNVTVMLMCTAVCRVTQVQLLFQCSLIWEND